MSNSASRDAGQKDLDALTKGIKRYLVDEGDGLVFDANAAESAGENQRVLEAGRNFNIVAEQNREARAADEQGSPASPGMETRGVSIPVWGNWCGPGHSGPGDPVDTLDTLCMRHDKCYAARGYFDCYCDAQLKAEIDRFASRMGSKERAMAAAVKMAFNVGLCNPF